MNILFGTSKCSLSDCFQNPYTGRLAFTFWVNFAKEPRYYWGGADPDSEVCACGMDNTCDEPGQKNNSFVILFHY